MPCQVSWQSVAIKSQGSVHSLGVEAVAAGGAFIGMVSAAHASTAHEAPATAKTIPVEIQSFTMRKLQRPEPPRAISSVRLFWSATSYLASHVDTLCTDWDEILFLWPLRHTESCPGAPRSI
jgi:hypothetical protein